MAEQDHTNGSHEGEGVVHADVGPEVAILSSSDARTQESLEPRESEASIRRLTTADMKPVEKFRSMDANALDSAMSAIKTRLPDEEEVVKGPFILSEIDHWDVARERVVFMTKKQLYSIRYDFVSCCVSEIKSIPLAIIDELLHGEISYSKFCLVYSHTGKALQVSWGKDYAPSFMERWNPFSTALKVTIFQSHVLFQKAHRSDRNLSLDAFIADLLEVIKQAKGADFEITEGPVWSETYLGVAALVHNQSHLGFNKRRGGLDW